MPLEEITERGVRLLGATMSNFQNEVNPKTKQKKLTLIKVSQMKLLKRNKLVVLALYTE